MTFRSFIRSLLPRRPKKARKSVIEVRAHTRRKPTKSPAYVEKHRQLANELGRV